MHTMRVKTAGGTIAVPALPAGTNPYSSVYLHHDQLGSIVAMTNTAGVVVERLAYDPWGKRRFINGSPDTLDAITSSTIDRGFTMHEHIDEMGIINMNGRIYDPLIGRFMSADPYIQAPDDLQSHNRYAYVMNNPLNLTDPSGFSWISKAWKKAWKSPIFKAILGIVVAVVAPYALTWLAPTLFGASSLATALATGALSGFASTGTLKGALTGAFTAGIMFGVGEIGQALKLESGGIGKVALHAGAGCVSSVAGGGSCKTGAISGALGELGNNIPDGGKILNTAKSAMLGGIGSKIAGGKFEDGATTGAFGYLFNELLHSGKGAMDRAGYQSQNNFESGFHTYEYESVICGASSAGCTEQAVFDALRKNPAPARFGTPDRQEGVSTGDRSFAQGVGMVEHTVGNRMITNTTIAGQHILNPGVVFREVLTTNNNVVIRTTGYGMGVMPNINSGAAVSYVWGTRTDSKIQQKFK